MDSPINLDKTKTHYLLPGTMFINKDPYMVSTVLGSCVSVILLDQVNSITGINHYMLPLWNGEGLPTPKYGNVAIMKMLEKMLSLGADRKNIRAKIFGGSSLYGKSKGLLDIGNRNISIARDCLSSETLPIVSSDVGGDRGRKLILNTDSGTVKIKMLGNVLLEAA